ncbi:discoidin domain-containing protein [Deinococcus sonorensis]|uniref:Discoidin domain-containing protein n=1 Tax=Deinococcus sonorensis KR-87 TaxID=694439 RepID=A0AAU7UGQ1_9DEIO
MPYSTATGGTTGTCGTSNLAQGRPASASSTENSGTPAGAAFDGNTGTRWASAWSDPQWLQVDLGVSRKICRVTLQWEAAYGKAFRLEASDDMNTWTPLYSTTTGTGGTQTLNVSGTGRYVRMTGTTRGTGYGYSLFEVQVYGTP